MAACRLHGVALHGADDDREIGLRTREVRYRPGDAPGHGFDAAGVRYLRELTGLDGTEGAGSADEDPEGEATDTEAEDASLGGPDSLAEQDYFRIFRWLVRSVRPDIALDPVPEPESINGFWTPGFNISFGYEVEMSRLEP